MSYAEHESHVSVAKRDRMVTVIRKLDWHRTRSTWENMYYHGKNGRWSLLGVLA